MFSTPLALFLGAVAVQQDSTADAAVQNCSNIYINNTESKNSCLNVSQCTYTTKCDEQYGMEHADCKCVDGAVELTAKEGGAYNGKLTGEECEACHGYAADLDAKNEDGEPSKKTCVARCEEFTDENICNKKPGCFFEREVDQYSTAGEPGECKTTCELYNEDGKDVVVNKTVCNTLAHGCQWVKVGDYNAGECQFVAGECAAKNATDDKCTELYKTMCLGGKCACDTGYDLADGVCKGGENAACMDNSHCSGDNVCHESVCEPKTVETGAGTQTQNFVESTYSSAAPTSLVVLFVALFCSA